MSESKRTYLVLVTTYREAVELKSEVARADAAPAASERAGRSRRLFGREGRTIAAAKVAVGVVNKED